MGLLLEPEDLRERARFLETMLPAEGDVLERPSQIVVIPQKNPKATPSGAQDTRDIIRFDQLVVMGIQYTDVEKTQRIAVTTDDGKLYMFDRSVRTAVLDAILIDRRVPLDAERRQQFLDADVRNQVEIFRHVYEEFIRFDKVADNRYTVKFDWLGGSWDVAFTGYGLGHVAQNSYVVALSAQLLVFRELDDASGIVPKMNFGDRSPPSAKTYGLLSKESLERLGLSESSEPVDPVNPPPSDLPERFR